MRRVELADDHVEGGGGGAAVAVLVHAPLGLLGGRGPDVGLVLVVAEGGAVGGAAEQLRLGAEAVRARAGPTAPAWALRPAHEEEPLGPAGVGRRVDGGEEARVRAVDVGVVDLPGQAVAAQRPAQGQVPADDVARSGVEGYSVGGGTAAAVDEYDGVLRDGGLGGFPLPLGLATGGRTIQPSSVSSGSGRRTEESAVMAAGVDGFLAGEGLRAGQYMFGCDRSSGDARLVVVEVNTNRSAVRVPEGKLQLDLQRYGTRSGTRLEREVSPFF